MNTTPHERHVPMRPRLSFGAWALAVAVGAAGCQTTTTKSLPTTPPDPPAVSVDGAATGTGANGGGGRSMTADEAVGTTPTVERLQDIQEQLMLYFFAHHELPPTLAEATGGRVPTTAPSGQPYLYAPHGMDALGVNKRILVADPAPTNGARWCILMPPVNGPRQASVSMEVVAVPEASFQAYRAVP